MGGQSQQNTNQNQLSTTTPWGAAAGNLQGILSNAGSINPNLTGTETGALNSLNALGAQGNQFAGQIGGVANNLLAGGNANAQSGLINNAYSQYQQQLNPYLQSSFLDPRNTPGFSDALNAVNSDITNQVNGQFAAAGRDMSGMNTQALARGLSQGEGQLVANQYNQNAQNQLGAMGSLYGAGNTTGGLLSGLNQQALANMQAGIGASGDATAAQQYGPLLQLQAAAQARGIPLATLAAQMGLTLPAAQAFGTTNTIGTGQNTGQLSGAQQFGTIAGGLSGLGKFLFGG
jgi:hypothetical protein